MIRAKTVLFMFFLATLFLGNAPVLGATTDLIPFYSDASHMMQVHAERLSFEKADSGNILIDAWVVRQKAGEETTEHWKFSFRLTVIKKILSGQGPLEQCFFPQDASRNRLYRALLRKCHEQNLFPQEIVALSPYLRG